MGAPTRVPIVERFTAEADQTGNQNLIAKAGSADGSAILAAVSGEEVLGVIPNSGVMALDTKPMDVTTDGGEKVIVGAAVAYNDKLMTDGDGKAITATTGKYYFARARGAATKADVVIPIVFERGILA